jgi:hypothetical protein
MRTALAGDRRAPQAQGVFLLVLQASTVIAVKKCLWTIIQSVGAALEVTALRRWQSPGSTRSRQRGGVQQPAEVNSKEKKRAVSGGEMSSHGRGASAAAVSPRRAGFLSRGDWLVVDRRSGAQRLRVLLGNGDGAASMMRSYLSFPLVLLGHKRNKLC